jgi:hypothetical protein
MSSQHETGEHAPVGPSAETARAQEIASQYYAGGYGKTVSAKDIAWVARNYPEFLQQTTQPALETPAYTLTPHERYEASAIGTEQVERWAFTRKKEREQSVAFYRGIGYAQLGGRYEPFSIPSGYAIKTITESRSGLQILFEKVVDPATLTERFAGIKPLIQLQEPQGMQFARQVGLPTPFTPFVEAKKGATGFVGFGETIAFLTGFAPRLPPQPSLEDLSYSFGYYGAELLTLIGVSGAVALVQTKVVEPAIEKVGGWVDVAGEKLATAGSEHIVKPVLYGVLGEDKGAEVYYGLKIFGPKVLIPPSMSETWSAATELFADVDERLSIIRGGVKGEWMAGTQDLRGFYVGEVAPRLSHLYTVATDPFSLFKGAIEGEYMAGSGQVNQFYFEEIAPRISRLTNIALEPYSLVKGGIEGEYIAASRTFSDFMGRNISPRVSTFKGIITESFEPLKEAKYYGETVLGRIRWEYDVPVKPSKVRTPLIFEPPSDEALTEQVSGTQTLVFESPKTVEKQPPPVGLSLSGVPDYAVKTEAPNLVMYAGQAFPFITPSRRPREAEEYDFTVLSYPKGTPKTVQEASSQAISKLGLNQLNLQSNMVGSLSKQGLSQDIIAQSVPVVSSGQGLDQMTKQLQRQTQMQKLETVSRSEYRRSGSFLDLPRYKKRRGGGFLDYGQVFRGWPVRKPTQLLRPNFGMGKTPTKSLHASVSHAVHFPTIQAMNVFPESNVWGKRTNRQSRRMSSDHAGKRKRR